MDSETVSARASHHAELPTTKIEQGLPHWFAEALLVIGAGAVAVAVAVAVWRVGPADWGLPWSNGDGATVYALAENMSRGHWFLQNPDLGYPYFQDQGHFPVTDFVPVALIALLAWVVPSSVTAVNIFSAFTFFSVASVTTGSFRFLGVGRLPAFVSGICFSLMPWHFERATGHIFLAHYISVPLTLCLVAVVARGHLDRGSLRLFFVALAAALVVAWNGVYYALMATLLLVGTLVLRWARTPRRIPGWRSLVVVAIVPVAVVLAIVVNRLSIATEATGEVVVRSLTDSVLYGGLVSSLFFPAASTTLGSRLSITLEAGNLENYAAMSSAAVIAVLISSWMVLYRWTSRAQIAKGSATFAVDYWPGALVAVTAFAAMGGLGLNFAAWVSDMIRAWGRFTIVVAGIAFLICALAVTAWTVSGNRSVRAIAKALPLVFLLLIAVDYSNGAYRISMPRAQAAETESYVAAIEERLPERCPVLELPLVLYPESPPVNSMTDYSHLWTYIYSTDLRWSYGGVKGTSEGEWGFDSASDLDALAAQAAQAGFCGVQVDTSSFANPADAASYFGAFGYPDVRSDNGRYLFFDLTGLRPGEAVVQAGQGFAPGEVDGDGRLFWWLTSPTGSVSVQGEPNADGLVRIRLFPPPCGPAQVGLGGRRYEVTSDRIVDVPVTFDASGEADIEVEARPGCSIDTDPRLLFVGLGSEN